MYDTLKRVADAESRQLDAWEIKLSSGEQRVVAGLICPLESFLPNPDRADRD